MLNKNLSNHLIVLHESILSVLQHLKTKQFSSHYVSAKFCPCGLDTNFWVLRILNRESESWIEMIYFNFLFTSVQFRILCKAQRTFFWVIPSTYVTFSCEICGMFDCLICPYVSILYALSFWDKPFNTCIRQYKLFGTEMQHALPPFAWV